MFLSFVLVLLSRCVVRSASFMSGSCPSPAALLKAGENRVFNAGSESTEAKCDEAEYDKAGVEEYPLHLALTAKEGWKRGNMDSVEQVVIRKTGGFKRRKVGRNNWNYFCQHGLRSSYCRDCGGGSICQHNRVRSQCKDCGGGAFCQHKRRRIQCKDCGGASICQHKRLRSTCKDCGGASICQHNRRRSQCKDCGGASICSDLSPCIFTPPLLQRYASYSVSLYVPHIARFSLPSLMTHCE